MVIHQIRSSHRVAPRDRIGNRAMLLLREIAADFFHVDPANEAHALVQVVEHARQLGVARHRRDAVVKGFVQLHQFTHLRAGRGGAAVGQEGLHLGDLCFACALHRVAQAFALYRHAGFVQVQNVLHLQRAAHVSARAGLQEAFGHEAREGFAHGGAADAQARGQFDFAQAFSGAQLVADRHVAQRFEHAAAALAAHGRDGGGLGTRGRLRGFGC